MTTAKKSRTRPRSLMIQLTETLWAEPQSVRSIEALDEMKINGAVIHPPRVQLASIRGGIHVQKCPTFAAACELAARIAKMVGVKEKGVR